MIDDVPKQAITEADKRAAINFLHREGVADSATSVELARRFAAHREAAHATGYELGFATARRVVIDVWNLSDEIRGKMLRKLGTDADPANMVLSFNDQEP